MTKGKNLALVVFSLMCCLALSLLLCGCGSDNKESESNENTDSAATETTNESSESQDEGSRNVHHAEMIVEGYDPITIELDADAAPITVANFIDLANRGYYNGLTFYRFQDGFCMQGGTYGNSASGNDPKLKPIVGEFASNGIDNPLANNFKLGVVAMARTNDPNSATSTFFVTLGSSQGVSESLNGEYAAFGTINRKGMAIVDRIVLDHLRAASRNPMGMIEDEKNQAVISSIKMID